MAGRKPGPDRGIGQSDIRNKTGRVCVYTRKQNENADRRQLARAAFSRPCDCARRSRARPTCTRDCSGGTWHASRHRNLLDAQTHERTLIYVHPLNGFINTHTYVLNYYYYYYYCRARHTTAVVKRRTRVVRVPDRSSYCDFAFVENGDRYLLPTSIGCTSPFRLFILFICLVFSPFAHRSRTYSGRFRQRRAFQRDSGRHRQVWLRHPVLRAVASHFFGLDWKSTWAPLFVVE